MGSTILQAGNIDLSAYLERIGYKGSLDPSLDLLSELVKLHMATIPFEAIDMLLGQSVGLAPATIDHKMLLEQRGGYCFEHASLMRRALQALGFSVEQHLARVWVNEDLHGPVPPATHTLLTVEAEGRLWLVDVGFGSLSPNQPLAWRPFIEQNTGFGAFRLAETRDGFLLESLYKDQWEPLYEILDFCWQPADFEVANDYISSHPDSPFRRDLIVTRTEPQIRTTLVGNHLKRVAIDGSRQDQMLDAASLTETLTEVFGLPLVAARQPDLTRIAIGTA